MIIGIDASNLRAGGGVTHLLELLRAADPAVHNFSKIIVWSGRKTLDQIADRHWLVKVHLPVLDKGLLSRTFWQIFRLSKLAKSVGCDLLFVPGGSYIGDFKPIVTFSQNLLPFEWRELKRFGWSLMTVKLILLRIIQSRTFFKADGVIFLTQYAKSVVMRVAKVVDSKTAVIPHGIDKRFQCLPREQVPSGEYSTERLFRILYVSPVDVYKHQWHVVEAAAKLRRHGLPVSLDLVGPARTSALKRLEDTISCFDPKNNFVNYYGPIVYSELHRIYHDTDMFLFASSCETFGQILAEAMSAGLPIACSNRSAMPEILGDIGVYFNPECPDDIAEAIRTLFEDSNLRYRLAKESFNRVKQYSWERCAGETFLFLNKVMDAK